jgi:hypothetical protein
MNVPRIIELLFYVVIVLIVVIGLVKVVEILADDNTLDFIMLPGLFS